MKLLKDLNAEIEATEMESLAVRQDMSPTQILSIIGVAAPILIKILQAWKAIPFTRSKERREKRNQRLDVWISALQMASMFSGAAPFIKP